MFYRYLFLFFCVAFVTADVRLKFIRSLGKDCAESPFNSRFLRDYCDDNEAFKACESRCTSMRDCIAYVVDTSTNRCHLYEQCDKIDAAPHKHLGKCDVNCKNDICKILEEKENESPWSSSEVEDALSDLEDDVGLYSETKSEIEDLVSALSDDDHLGRKDLKEVGEDLKKIIVNNSP